MLLYFHLKLTLHNTDIHSKIHAKIFNFFLFLHLESNDIANKKHHDKSTKEKKIIPIPALFKKGALYFLYFVL